jgi:hypothetical protein
MGLSDKALIHFINGLFDANHPPDASVSRPSTESIGYNLKQSLADSVITIDNKASYIAEAQISDDENIVIRIFQYILNKASHTTSPEGRILHVKLHHARVIYWEHTGKTPDKEIVCFEFPDGSCCRYEIPNVKFSEYTTADLEEKNLTILLPFCVLKLRRAVKKAESGEERRALAKQMRELIKEIAAAAERSEKAGKMSRGDVGNIIRLTRRLHDELYWQYTEMREEEEGMWEDIQLVDYDGAFRRLEEAEREIARKAEEAIRQAEQAFREKQEAARKLRELGVSDEQLAAAGLLNIAGK